MFNTVLEQLVVEAKVERGSRELTPKAGTGPARRQRSRCLWRRHSANCWTTSPPPSVSGMLPT